MIQFDMLGQIALRDAAGESVDRLLRQPKRLALLAYLASPVPGTWHRRDTVLALFWPELDSARARTAMRNTVYVLRQALGDDVIRNRGDDELAVVPEALTTDLSRLRQALAEGDHTGALREYRGELLPAFFPPDCAGFEQWLESERGRLRNEVATLALRAAAGLQAEGDFEAALTLTRRVLEIQPDDETILRRMMLLHEASADQVGGLAAFEAHRLRLDREYAAKPAAETIALAERLRGGAHSAAVVPPPAGGPAPRATDATPAARATTGPVTTARPRRRWLVGAILTGMAALLVLAARTRPREWMVGTSRPVTAEEGLQIEPAISPSGRLIAYAQGTAKRMRVFVTRVDGGTPWPVSRDSMAVEIMPRWAPDNDALVYLARNNAYLAVAVGGAVRVIAEGGPDERAVRSASWSPRGDSLLIVRGDSLLVVPLDGVGARLVGTGTQLHSCLWSPSHQWIACVSGNWISFAPGPLFGNRAPSALVLFPVGGGPAISLTDHDAEHLSPAWSADGEELWFLSNRDGTSGEVYAARIGRDGTFEGAPRRVGLTAEAISLASDGMAYSVPSRRANVWAATLDGPMLRPFSEATRLTAGNQIVEVVHATPGQPWLTYDSNLRGNSDIYRIQVTGGPAERLTDDERPEFAGALSPDGREVVFHQWNGPDRRLRIRRLADGVVSEPAPAAGDQSVPRWSPDGTAIAYWAHGSEPGAISVIRRGEEETWEAPRWTLDGAQLPIWSPDGRRVAYLTPKGDIQTISADSGASTLLYAPRAGSDDPLATFLAWHAAWDRVWFLGHRPSGESGIWWIPEGGGAVPVLALSLENPEGRANGPSLTTDGKRFFFTMDERVSNIRWAALRH